ncbi:MAG: prepilin-type N-terminal cleavage/methylation domain-containing protein [Nitrospinota bacterium]
MSYELKVKNDSGLTLIELLIAMAIGLVVLGSIFSSFTSQKKAFALQEQVTDMEQNLRIPMDFITRDLRNTGYNPTEILVAGTSVGLIPGGTRSINITTNQLRILADLTGDGGTGDSGEEVDYSLDGTAYTDGFTYDIYRNGQPLVENVTALTFTYYDSAGNTIATPVTGSNLANIRLVQISLTARTTKEDANFTSGVNISGTTDDGTCRTRTLTARVRTRNIGLK